MSTNVKLEITYATVKPVKAKTVRRPAVKLGKTTNQVHDIPKPTPKPTEVKLPYVRYRMPYMGCDPEFFFKFNGQVIGAEKVIPEAGLNNSINKNLGTALGGMYDSKFIIDGVQAELNPRPNICRANLGNEIAACFTTLKLELAKKGNNITCDFSRAVEIPKENLMELSEKSRKFGCAPSNSIYEGKSGIDITTVDPSEYRIRAAGGHIHIGKSDSPDIAEALTTRHKKTVAMLDLIVGNTCVLIDRDASNIERRKVYGKAGEFRLPAHGLEYRTLSNFWLQAYPIMSLVFGLVRFAVELMADSRHHELFYDTFMSKVSADDVRDAINNNDFDLAMKNFKAIEPCILQAIGDGGSHYLQAIGDRGSHYPFAKGNLAEFHHFIEVVNTKGMNYWFPEDPMTHWTNLGECHTGGFYDFLYDRVRKDLMKPAEA